MVIISLVWVDILCPANTITVLNGHVIADLWIEFNQNHKTFNRETTYCHPNK